jgi:hypothetical protein
LAFLLAVGAASHLEGQCPDGGTLLWWALQFRQFDALRSEPRFQRVIDESRPPGAR